MQDRRRVLQMPRSHIAADPGIVGTGLLCYTSGPFQHWRQMAMSTEFKSDFLREIAARGFIHQCTDGPALDELARKKPIAAYIGFDATADSLHVGSLVSIMLLRRMQQAGHKPIVLMGGGTTKIGDPSFRDESR